MNKENGQALLETALVLPIILILFCGIVDFGRILFASNHLNMVTQEAARLAGLGKGDYEITQFVKDKVIFQDKSAVTVNISPSEYTRKSGDYTTLKVTYDIKYITPLINIILPSPFSVNTQSTIRVE